MASNPRWATDLQCKVGQVTKLPSTSVSSSLKLGLTWVLCTKCLIYMHTHTCIHCTHTDLIILFFIFQEKRYKPSLKGARAMKHKVGTKNWTG